MDENERTCNECGGIIEDGTGKEIDGEWYCNECAEEFEQCANCGEWGKRDEMTETPDGDYYCNDCADENLYHCEYCGAVMWEQDLISLATSPYQRRRGNTECVCNQCADTRGYQCSDCGEWYTEEIQQVSGGDYVCSDCLDDYYYCENCGEYVHYDNWDSDNECCTDCADDCGLIREYHSKPTIEYYGECKKAWRGIWRGIGVELEIDRESADRENEHETAEEIANIAGERLYFNRDGSLNYGFEIITQPHTETEFYKIDWEQILTVCREHGYLSHDIESCGLHLHISRDMFGSNENRQGVAISKLIRFYDLYYTEILKVSRRTSSQADRWASSYNTQNRKQAEQFGKIKGAAGRYYAVNNTNRNTVEIRITRGTLNYNTFNACIDFMLTVAKNSRRIAWNKVNNAAEWLKGLKPETITYLKSREAFTEVL